MIQWTSEQQQEGGKAQQIAGKRKEEEEKRMKQTRLCEKQQALKGHERHREIKTGYSWKGLRGTQIALELRKMQWSSFLSAEGIFETSHAKHEFCVTSSYAWTKVNEDNGKKQSEKLKWSKSFPHSAKTTRTQHRRVKRKRAAVKWNISKDPKPELPQSAFKFLMEYQLKELTIAHHASAKPIWSKKQTETRLCMRDEQLG